MATDLPISGLPTVASVLDTDLLTSVRSGDPAGTKNKKNTALQTKNYVNAGKAGSKTIEGGTGASENLVLESTSHGTKGEIQIANGTKLHANTANYETLVTDNDDIPNKKYVDDQVGGKDEFAELDDVTAPYSNVGALTAVNGSTDGMLESTTLLSEPAANQFTLTRGTSAFVMQANLMVSGNSTINQNVSTAGTPSFAQLNVDNVTIDGETINTPTDVNLTLSPGGVGSVNATKNIGVQINDTGVSSSTNTILLYHTITGTPAAGIGLNIVGYTESLGSSFKQLFEIDSTFTDVTDGTEKGKLEFNVMTNGSMATAMELDETTMKLHGRKIESVAAPATYLAAETITGDETNLPVAGNGGAVISTAIPVIAAGVDGETKRLIGTNDTNTLTLTDDGGTNGLALDNGQSFALGENDIIEFIAYNSLWIETSRKAN